MPFQEYVIRWTGGPIGAGATVLHFQSVGTSAAAATIASATKTLGEALKAIIPQDVTLRYDSEVKEIANDGTLLAVYPVTAPAATPCTGVGVYAAGTGAMIRHNTGLIIGGRRVLGRTFVVPLLGTSYSNAGSIAGASLTAINNAFTALNTSTSGVGAGLAVWSKKNAAVAPVITSATQGRVSTLATRNDRP